MCSKFKDVPKLKFFKELGPNRRVKINTKNFLLLFTPFFVFFLYLYNKTGYKLLFYLIKRYESTV